MVARSLGASVEFLFLCVAWGQARALGYLWTAEVCREVLGPEASPQGLCSGLSLCLFSLRRIWRVGTFRCCCWGDFVKYIRVRLPVYTYMDISIYNSI